MLHVQFQTDFPSHITIYDKLVLFYVYTYFKLIGDKI